MEPALNRVAQQPTWLLSRANARAQRLLTEAFAAEGLRPVHFRLLAALDQYGPVSQADLGRHTGTDRSDVVATLDELVAARLAKRSPDAADRRRNIVTVTNRGMKTLRRLDRLLDEVQESVLAPLSPARRKTLVAILNELT